MDLSSKKCSCLFNPSTSAWQKCICSTWRTMSSRVVRWIISDVNEKIIAAGISLVFVIGIISRTFVSLACTVLPHMQMMSFRNWARNEIFVYDAMKNKSIPQLIKCCDGFGRLSSTRSKFFHSFISILLMPHATCYKSRSSNKSIKKIIFGRSRKYWIVSSLHMDILGSKTHILPFIIPKWIYRMVIDSDIHYKVAARIVVKDFLREFGMGEIKNEIF